MADGGGVRNDILAIIQAVDLEYGATLFVDYFADPRFADEVIVTDTFDRQVIYNRTFADSVTVIDDVSKVQEHNRDFADSVAMADASSRLSVFSRVFDDVVVVTDNQTAVLDTLWFLDVADSVTMADNFTFVWNRILFLNLADAVTMGDAVSALTGNLIQLGDAVTMSDAGVLTYYDYAGSDYFLTPFDYVISTRVF
jgi:hypothetical protein